MGIPIESVSIFWFVLALFGGWNLYNAIVQLKSVRMQCFLSAGCVVLGYFLTKLSKIWPFCLPMVLIAVGYLAAGEWIRKNHLLRKKFRCYAGLLWQQWYCFRLHLGRSIWWPVYGTSGLLMWRQLLAWDFCCFGFMPVLWNMNGRGGLPVYWKKWDFIRFGQCVFMHMKNTYSPGIVCTQCCQNDR